MLFKKSRFHANRHVITFINKARGHTYSQIYAKLVAVLLKSVHTVTFSKCTSHVTML
jgi:hypothetical protein